MARRPFCIQYKLSKLFTETDKSGGDPELMLFTRFLCGEALLESIDQGHLFDIIFLDVQLTGMDGNDAGREIRIKNPDVLIVFCSGIQLTVPPRVIRETAPYITVRRFAGLTGATLRKLHGSAFFQKDAAAAVLRRLISFSIAYF